MSLEKQQEVLDLLERALEKPPGERPAFLDEACAADPSLHREVAALLATEEAPELLADPAFDVHDDPVLGRSIGPYKLVRLLGSGGMGAVYLAEREDFEKRVALKLIRRGLDLDPTLVRRFHNERQILARLEHPNIARLLDGGTTDDRLPYFVMEFVEGEPIDRYCDVHELSLRLRLELVCKVASAVEFAHRNLVVHRDLKPGNVLVTAAGEPKLLDFGIAKLLDDGLAVRAVATAAGRGPMTPRYASPEQIRCEPVSTASDVYSLGVVLYELLTGLLPYRLETEGDGELARAIREQEPRRPSTAVRSEGLARGGLRPSDPRELGRRLSGDLDGIVLKALDKEPEGRYGSVEQLSEDVRRHLRGLPVSARPPTLVYRAGKFVRRHRLRLTTALVLAVLFAASITTTVRGHRQRQRADRAVHETEALSAFLESVFRASDPAEAQGERLTAGEILERGRKEIESHLGDEPLLYATLAAVLGRVYRSRGEYGASLPLLEDALRIRREVLGDDHLLVASSLHHLALLSSRLGDYPRAEDLTREALAIQRRHYRGAHPDLARGINNLASLHHRRGDYARAEALFREALAMKGRLYGEDHPEVLQSMNNLAASLLAEGRDAAAEEIYRRVLAIRRGRHGPAHTDVATSLNNLGKVLFLRERFEEAESAYREALGIRREILGARHPAVATALNNLGRVLVARERLDEAEDVLRAALDVKRDALGEDHVSVATTKRNLAAVLLARGEPAVAEPLARQAVEILREARLEDAGRLAVAESLLGGCLAALGRYAEAEPILADSYSALVRTLGREALETREAHARLVDLSEVRSPPVEAAGRDGG